MKIFHRAIVAICMFAAASAASATTFSVTNALFTPGSGYGIDNSEATNVATLLDVRFSSAAFAAQGFDLNTVGSFSTFDVGTISFLESNMQSGIVAAETDNLGVSLALTFTAPGNVVNQIIATGAAVIGSVQDNATDFTLTWSPITRTFGTTGLYSISFGNLAFATAANATQTLVATVTLLAPDTAAPVPEPASITLLSIGLLGVGLLRRRNQK